LVLLSPSEGDALAATLAMDGFCVLDAAFPNMLIDALTTRIAALDAQDQLTPAGIGRADQHQQARAIRRDLTHWLTGQHPDEAHFLALMEDLRLTLNRALFLGLYDFEAHFAIYEPGAFYARHRDAFEGQRNRVVSVVLYLNREWQAGDGGELVLYSTDEASVVAIIEPLANRLVVFLSEDMPHEVLVASHRRCSIAGWFRVNDGAPPMIG
jgi:SM-20-related protein